MRCLIITGGPISTEFAKQYTRQYQWDCLIVADGGLHICKLLGLEPDFIIGDFDSVKKEILSYFRECMPERIHQFPVKKNETDTELAIQQAKAAGAESVYIIGATGGRSDHFLGNLSLLEYASSLGMKAYIVDEYNRIRLIDSDLKLEKKNQYGKYVSLIPFGEEVRGLTLKGFLYTVSDFTLELGNSRGISNQILEEEAFIHLDSGKLLVIEARD